MTRIEAGPRPKHAQLRDALAELAAELSPDSAIPSERGLMERYDVSRATVRKAIDALVSDGLLVRVHGRGTFVARPRLEEPPADVASVLALGPGDRAWRLHRVRLADGQPIALENGWYPEPALPGLDRHDLGGSLYELLRTGYGLTIDSAEQTLWGEAADEVVADRLDCPPQTPLLVFRRVSSADGRPVEHVVSRYRGDRYQIHMSLGRDEIDPSPTPGDATERKRQ